MIDESVNLDAFFRKSQLIPAIVQDHETNEILMLAYMNKESLQLTLKTGYTWFWSRSRQELWNKGAHSGHTQKVLRIDYDCDEDTLLVKVEQIGPACHTGNRSCFFRTLFAAGDDSRISASSERALYELSSVIEKRRNEPEEGSYTCYLFEQGIDKMLKKVGEECTETVIAAKNQDNEELKNEISDLLYHLLVMMNERKLPLSDVMDELDMRSKKIGNLKKMKKVDRNS